MSRGARGSRRRSYGGAGEVDSEGTWAISYGDMITLLLTFFILFFDLDKNKKHAQALQQSLVAVLAPLKLESPASAAPVNRSMAIGKIPGPEIDLTIVEDWGGKIHKKGDKVLVEFPGISFFESGDLRVTAVASRALEKFVRLYTPFAGHYLLGIRAYTDLAVVTPKHRRHYADNLELSALRGVATMRVLQHLGIPLARMKIGGYGEMHATEAALGRKPSSLASLHEPLSRKVVLVIEPELVESL